LALDRSVLVARLLWVIPAILLFLTINQAKVALDLRETLEDGVPVEAEVIEIETSGRVDVTMASARLRLQLPEGEVVERELPLPITFAEDLQGSERLEVRVNPGADQEIVIAELGRAQWRLAAINSAMSLIGLVLVTIGVFAWNRYLRRKGDPARRTLEEPVEM